MTRLFRVLTVILVILSTNGLSAQELNSLLYKVSKKNKESFYLFGTVHMLPQEDFNLKQKVKGAISESDVLVLEIDISDPSMQMKIMQSATMENKDSIQHYLDAEQCASLNAMLIESAGLPLVMFQNMKPFIISSLLINRYVGSQPASFEFSLASFAERDSIEILGLEGIEEQMAVFDSIPYSDQAEGLIEMIENEDEMKTLFRDVIEAYKSEDVDALYELLNSNMTSEEEQYYLLEKRNLNWIGRIEKIAEKNKAFIAVGAGHLGGDKGLIKLFKEKGYSVESLPDLNE